MSTDLPKRKHQRLKVYDYNNNGYYFLTICTKNRKCILGCVGNGVPGVPPKELFERPTVNLSEVGKIVERCLLQINSNGVWLDSYVIMPNHVHMILVLEGCTRETSLDRHNKVSNTVAYIKRTTNMEAGQQLWQKSFYDHIIRWEEDYIRICEYIDNNPMNWITDEYY